MGLIDGIHPVSAASGGERRFHLSIGLPSSDDDFSRFARYRDSGVTDIWVPGFFYGHWPTAVASIRAGKLRIESAGLACHVVNIPLGHPGDSLGAGTDDFPLTPPKHWRLAVRPDGSTHAGTSLHEPATDENVRAVRQLCDAGFKRFFLDDDFRLATGPGIIGGCFCKEHEDAFLRKYGYAEPDWEELLGNVRDRRLTAILRNWVDDVCDRLTACFRAQRSAIPDAELGNMVMYMGAEKAGIRLDDYHGAPLRVGELMFDDASFGTVKNKTSELFSALFHRRFVMPDQAYSETTAFPADHLSARNMAAKLAVSTIADVRNTMFMSGLTPFPVEHWAVLAPAMKKHASIHRKLAGHVPRGPFRHFWGGHGRYTGDDNPWSLFLASGIPFEVTGTPAKDGWTFLGDQDARAAVSGELASPGTTFVVRPEAGVSPRNGITVAETPDALFDLKRRIKNELKDIPHIMEDIPAVFAWYPTARSALVWNVNEERRSFTVAQGPRRLRIDVDGLEVALIDIV